MVSHPDTASYSDAVSHSEAMSHGGGSQTINMNMNRGVHELRNPFLARWGRFSYSARLFTNRSSIIYVCV